MTEHLSDADIALYVERRGDADSILAIAQHLDHCWECRDRTAAIVDDGADDRPHVGGTHDNARTPLPDETSRFRYLPWVILIAIAIVAILIALRVSALDAPAEDPMVKGWADRISKTASRYPRWSSISGRTTELRSGSASS